MVGLAGEVEAVAPVRPDLAGHPDRRAAVDQVAALLDVQLDERPDARPAAPGPPPSTTSSSATPSRSRSAARLRPTSIAPVASREPRQASPNRDPSSSTNTDDPDRPRRHERRARAARRPPPAPRPRRAARRTPRRRAPSRGASRSGRRRPGSRRRRHQATRLPVASDSAQAAGRGLLAEPVGELALGRGERLPEVAAGRRRTGRPARGRTTSARSRRARPPSNGSARRSATGTPRTEVSDPRPRILAGMEFQDVVRRRRMVRDYSDEPVDPAVVDLALANAVRAPSAGFSQGWAFLVLDTPDDVRRFWAATAEDLDRPGQLAGRDDARAGGDPAVLEQGARTCAGTPRRTRAGPTSTRRAGRCRSGTWTPRWRAC